MLIPIPARGPHITTLSLDCGDLAWSYPWTTTFTCVYCFACERWTQVVAAVRMPWP